MKKRISTWRALTALTTSNILLGVMAAGSAQAGPIWSHLGQSLVGCGSGEDADHDCLKDSMEKRLAEDIAPALFFDREEGCGRGSNRQRNFYQVRPGWNEKDTGINPETDAGQVHVARWQPGSTHHVTVVYHLLFPKDCGDATFGVGGHNGDAERVEYRLSSSDLMNWRVENAKYNQHKNHVTIPRERLELMAEGINRPLVAVGKNKHASWPGRNRNTDECGGNASWSTDHCFHGSPIHDIANGLFDIVPVEHNIGEHGAFILGSALQRDSVGHFSLDPYGTTSHKEYWDAGNSFCGWLGGGTCVGPLTNKVAKHLATRGAVFDGCTRTPDNKLLMIRGDWAFTVEESSGSPSFTSENMWETDDWRSDFNSPFSWFHKTSAPIDAVWYENGLLHVVRGRTIHARMSGGSWATVDAAAIWGGANAPFETDSAPVDGVTVWETGAYKALMVIRGNTHYHKVVGQSSWTKYVNPASWNVANAPSSAIGGQPIGCLYTDQPGRFVVLGGRDGRFRYEWQDTWKQAEPFGQAFDATYKTDVNAPLHGYPNLTKN